MKRAPVPIKIPYAAIVQSTYPSDIIQTIMRLREELEEGLDREKWEMGVRAIDV